MSSSTPQPLVSIAIPVFNGEDLVARAVESALDQNYSNLEIVVVDDASTDGTVKLLRTLFGDRIRLFRNDARSGQARTTNTSIGLARGELIKLLHHDDYLDPRCVSRMTEALVRHPSAGMVFCRRRVELASDSADARAWLERYGDPPRGFGSLEELNAGSRIFEQLLANGIYDNWIGEPVCVMVRRQCFDRVGGFALQVHGVVDLDLWLRICSHYDVAFIDEELATYRHSASSHVGRAHLEGAHWLDRLWTLEDLNAFPGLASRFPQIREMRRQERRMAFRTVARQLGRRQRSPAKLSLWGEYARFRMRGLIGLPSRSPDRRAGCSVGGEILGIDAHEHPASDREGDSETGTGPGAP